PRSPAPRWWASRFRPGTEGRPERPGLLPRLRRQPPARQSRGTTYARQTSHAQPNRFAYGAKGASLGTCERRAAQSVQVGANALRTSSFGFPPANGTVTTLWRLPGSKPPVAPITLV